MAKHTFPTFTQEYSDRWRESGLWTDQTLHDAFDAAVETCPEKLALVDGEKRYSMREFQQASKALASGLLEVGVEKGDIVGIQMPNWSELCLLHMALSRIGAVIQPLHIVYGERELRNLLDFNDTDVVVVAGQFRGKDYAAQMRDAIAGLDREVKVIVVRDQALEKELRFDEVLDKGRKNPGRVDDLGIEADTIFYLNFTSGTTGNPKGFMHSHNTLISVLFRAISLMANNNTDRIGLACSPMSHSYGIYEMYGALLGGTTMVLVERFSPTLILELVEREKVTHVSGTPAHWMSIINHPDFEKYDTSSIASAGVGGATSPPELIEALEKIWGVKTGNSYGMGETIIHCATSPSVDSEDKLRKSVGRQVPWIELKVVDVKDRSRQCEVGEVGEIVFRGPTLFVGYHNQPEKTQESRDDEGWFYTSDLGYVDEDDYFYIVGRTQEVINRGGTKIYPKEVESLLCAHPDITDAAVVSMPDERLGAKVCAFVIPRGEDLTLEQIKNYFGEIKAMKYLVPEALINVKKFPLTPTGKVRKVELQEEANKIAQNQ